MIRGRAATPEPFDIGAVAGSDELFEALATRRLADLNTGYAESDDPAASLLAALVADVDVGAPALPARPHVLSCGTSSRRRGVRTFVTLGVAALVLTSAGAAAAGGGHAPDAMRTVRGPTGIEHAQRSNENAQQQSPITPPVDHRPVERHPGRLHRIVPDKDEPMRLPDDRREHRSPRWDTHPSRRYAQTPDRVTPAPDPSEGQPATPAPEDHEFAR